MENKKFKDTISFFCRKDILTIFVWISVIVYVSSCFFPAATTRKDDVIYGYMCLLGGGLSILLVELIQLAIWSANIFYIAGVWRFCRGRKRKSLKFFIIASVLGLCMLAHPYITGDIEVEIEYFGIGYYLWILSFFIMFMVNLIVNKRRY